MDPIANKRLLCDALQAQRMPADMSQAPALMLARLMGLPAAVHWSDKKPIDKPNVTWKAFQSKELASLGEVSGAAEEIDRRWASLKAALLKPTDLEIAHDNAEELKTQILSDGWKCILEDKTASWYRKTVAASQASTDAKGPSKRMASANGDESPSKTAKLSHVTDPTMETTMKGDTGDTLARQSTTDKSITPTCSKEKDVPTAADKTDKLAKEDAGKEKTTASITTMEEVKDTNQEAAEEPVEEEAEEAAEDKEAGEEDEAEEEAEDKAEDEEETAEEGAAEEGTAEEAAEEAAEEEAEGKTVDNEAGGANA